MDPRRCDDAWPDIAERIKVFVIKLPIAPRSACLFIIMIATLTDTKKVKLPGIKCAWRIAQTDDVRKVDQCVFVRLSAKNHSLLNIVREQNALAPSPLPEDFRLHKCSLGLMKLIELRNIAQATCLLDDEQNCNLWDTDEDKEEKPKKFPKLSRGAIEAKRKDISAMDIDVPDTDPVQTVRVLRPVQPRDNLFVEYTAESLGNALFFIRNAGFCELGANALSKEECWFTVLTERSTTLKDVAAGLSQTFGEVIKLFVDTSGFDISKAGISLPFEPDDIRLWAKVGVIIQDGSAHKYVWSSRGDAGSRICLLCKNLVSAASEMLDSDNTNLLRSNTIKLNELEASTDAELRANARHLEAHYGTMTETDFTALQLSGWCHRAAIRVVPWSAPGWTELDDDGTYADCIEGKRKGFYAEMLAGDILMRDARAAHAGSANHAS